MKDETGQGDQRQAGQRFWQSLSITGWSQETRSPAQGALPQPGGWVTTQTPFAPWP